MQDEKEIKEIILYGAGKRTQRILEYIRFVNMEKVYIVDSDKEKWGNCLDDWIIQPPDFFSQRKNTCFCITLASEKYIAEIRQILLEKYDCNLSREISYGALLRYIYRNHTGIRQKIIEADLGNKEKSIIFDCYNGLGLGGIESWTKDVSSGLFKKYGKKIRILTRKGDYNINEEIERMVDYYDEMIPDSNLIDEKLYGNLQYLLRKLPCTVITSQADDVLMAASIIKKYYVDKIKIISVIHGSEEKIYKCYDVYRNDIDLYVGVSKDIKRDMMSRGIERERVCSMTCPFPCERKIQRTYTQDKTKPVRIGYAGRIEYEQKRIDLLLKLIEKLSLENINFIMELAGDGPQKAQMEQEVVKIGVEEKVRFLGKINRDKISEFWRRQDICVNISDYEGRSISIIEAMGNGAVPIVTDTSGVREDITNDSNGYIVSKGDYEMMAEKIRYLEANRACLSKMGKLAHDSIYPKSLMKPHLDFWEKILESE